MVTSNSNMYMFSESENNEYVICLLLGIDYVLHPSLLFLSTY